MSMYLPNPDVHPIGSEAAEFIEAPPVTDRSRGTARRLDARTRLDITRLAAEYITHLVEDHNGAPEDVRSIIRDLYDQPPATEHGAS